MRKQLQPSTFHNSRGPKPHHERNNNPEKKKQRQEVHDLKNASRPSTQHRATEPPNTPAPDPTAQHPNNPSNSLCRSHADTEMGVKVQTCMQSEMQRGSIFASDQHGCSLARKRDDALSAALPAFLHESATTTNITCAICRGSGQEDGT